MKKVLLLLTVLWVAAVNVFGQNPTTLWENNGDIDWYNTQDSEFTLSTSAELSGLSILVASGNSFVGITISIGADLDLGAHLWTKIGIDHNAPFSGIFDGNNHIISNLIVDMPGTSFVGLFGRCFGATIQNVRLMNPFVRGKDSVGSLAGNVWDAVLVENCHATGVDVVATGDNIGGLVGDAYGPGEFIRCYSQYPMTTSIKKEID